MFDHAFSNYMIHAYPADELMPLSCAGRVRGVTKSRGDIDDALGNFSLTLVDTLDTLYIMGKINDFDQAVHRVIEDVSFDRDVVVSVFETNIRMLGGLLSGHVMARHAQQTGRGLSWYSGQLLKMAEDLGERLLPAFTSSSGLPHPRVNLRRGLDGVPHERTTCTACAGSVLLEMGALSRLTGRPEFEEKARRAMFTLWDKRNRYTNLVGSIMNVDTGEWVRSDSGVGAGSDSYYEYLLKAYVLLGDVESYHRFAQHYESIIRYQLREGFLVDVPMHSPHSTSRNLVDALSAFWPGLQTLLGDIPNAVKAHEMLYGLVRKYRFLPEAVTLSDYRTHWAHHPLRPEFVESTYFLYRATKDPHYLEVGRDIMQVLNATCRVKCGFAAIEDVNKVTLSDQMDSFLLAETFKYLYLLFSEQQDLPLDLDDYVFTTEGHPLPLSLSEVQENIESQELKQLYSRINSTTCPNLALLHNDDLTAVASKLRAQVRASYPNLGNIRGTKGLAPTFSRHNSPADFVEQQQQQYNQPHQTVRPLINAADFIADNSEHIKTVGRMGLVLTINSDGRAQLWHRPETAETPELAAAGLVFMRDMVVLQAQQEKQTCGAEQSQPQYRPIRIWLISSPHCGNLSWNGGPSQFGLDVETSVEVQAPLSMTHIEDGCIAAVENGKPPLEGTIAVTRRGGCTFAEKARAAQAMGAVGLIVVDVEEGTSQESTPFFALSADSAEDIDIPVTFMFNQEGTQLIKLIESTAFNPDGEKLTAMFWRQPKDKTEEEELLKRSLPSSFTTIIVPW